MNKYGSIKEQIEDEENKWKAENINKTFNFLGDFYNKKTMDTLKENNYNLINLNHKQLDDNRMALDILDNSYKYKE